MKRIVLLALLIVCLSGCGGLMFGGMRCSYQPGSLGCPTQEELKSSYEDRCVRLQDKDEQNLLFEGRYKARLLFSEDELEGYAVGKYYRIRVSPYFSRVLLPEQEDSDALYIAFKNRVKGKPPIECR